MNDTQRHLSRRQAFALAAALALTVLTGSVRPGTGPMKLAWSIATMTVRPSALKIRRMRWVF